MIKRILVGVAGTPSAPSKLHHAFDLARRHDASISVLSVVDFDTLRARVGPVPVGGAHYAGRMVEAQARESAERADGAIQLFEEEGHKTGIPVRIEQRKGDPFEHLAELWRVHDLCIMGCRGWFDYGVVPEPDAMLLRLIKRGVRPILAVHEKIYDIRTVLVGYSGSLESAKAMKRFAQMRLWPDARVHVAHFANQSSEPKALLAEAEDYLTAHGFAVTTSVEPDDPREGIRRLAGEIGADLKVLGSSYRTALFGESFGKTALHYLRTADRPVFITH